MMRTTSHIGLSLALLVAPALCCCNLRWFAAAGEPPPLPASAPAKSTCCQKTCCREAEQDPASAPQKAPAPRCSCLPDRPVAAHTEAKPDIPSAEFTGLIVPTAIAPAADPDHAALAAGQDPPERAGVDARSAALFARHVMRC